MERWAAKLICLVGVFILPFVCTLIPFKVHTHFAKKGEQGKKVLSCLMCFGGGVFFATFMLHMGPEVRYILDEALIKPYNIRYPLADLIMSAGFFLVFILEKIILKFYKKNHQRKQRKRNEQCYQFNKINANVGGCDPQDLPWDDTTNRISESDASNITHVGNGTVTNTATPGAATNDCPLFGTGECCNDSKELQMQMSVEETVVIAGDDSDKKDDIEIGHAHATRSLVLIVALSLHRIFEGMSLGLQHTTQNVFHLFLAVICHETVIGFGLGLQFVKNNFTLCRMVVATTLCSLIMPVGVAIGTILVEVGGESDSLNMVNGILQAISTGTFIYVTFFEILQEEIDPHDTSISKFFSVFIGFGVMACLSAVPENQNLLVGGVITDPCNVTEALVHLSTAAP